ncbi:fasciclin domain-containing protein [Nocardioides sp. Y6]|uniref:Fasciclin domain-containing protein n=1 Tax=Nocardioides malaquae TaxID=2773426 RepID=A0ABR9RPR3_9ACTN|nr:fasciclin domain-containing protein [Nocardioides malaquae]MBE7323548.1 fasciclin domain-containing protein [Nocardioides malaquae]
MKIRTLAATLASAALLGTGLLAPGAASAAEPTGDRDLATVLTGDGNRFDRNFTDYDIVTEAVLAVLAAKPDSAVSVLTDGDVALTAFLPNDASFKLLAKDLTGRYRWSEKATFQALVDAVGVDTIEQVLLYHVVPGATIDSATALGSDGAALATAQGSEVTVDVLSKRWGIVKLRDQDRNDIDPLLVPGKLDINKGNKQIAHDIFLVLRPIDV